MDYDLLAEQVGDPDWSYEALLPFFKKTEKYEGNYPNHKAHGETGDLFVSKLGPNPMVDAFVNAAKEMGFQEKDPNGPQTQSFARLDVTLKDGIRWGTYNAFLKPILKRRTLTIYRYSRVIKVHLDRQKNAYGVTYMRHGMQKFVRARKEIIVSAGAVDSPKLLMLSGIGIKKRLHQVGVK